MTVLMPCFFVQDFDLCVTCYHFVGHEHPMDKLGLGLDDDMSFQEGPKDPKEQRKASIEKCIRYLVHATKCHDLHCKQPSCIKMKRVLTHTRGCKLMLSSKWNMCKICKQFVLLCIAHAKNCNEDKCPVPVCARIKKNLHDQRNQQQVRRQRFMQLRMAQMSMTSQMASVQNANSVASPATNTSPSNPTSLSQGQVYHQQPQQRGSQLQQMLQAGPLQQQYAAVEQYGSPQMSAHPHMTRPPPPQYPMPQTAEYPQVLGLSHPMPVPSPQMGQHIATQVHHQYGEMAQMDPSGGMQAMDPPGYMYQQQLQYGLNTNKQQQQQFSSAGPTQCHDPNR